MLGLGLSEFLRREAAGNATFAPAARNVIMIWLAGGPATIDMWDMKPEAPSGVRGEFSPIATSLDGVQICEHLPRLAKAMHLVSVVRSVHHTLAAHEPGSQLLMTGNLPGPALEYPALGSIAAMLLAPARGVPTFTTMGEELNAGAGYLGAAYNPFPVAVAARFGEAPSTPVGLPDGFSVETLHRRERLLRAFDGAFRELDRSPIVRQMERFQLQALDMLRSNATREALDLAREPEESRARYGNRPLGMRLLAARRLVEAGVRFVTVGMPGWDTHGNNFGQLRTALLPELDQALAALLVDLDQRGLLESTIVYCTGEFGRTPIINGGGGRDHWARAMAVLLAGGRLRRGFVYGATDPQGYEPVEDGGSPMDVSATVLAALGIAHDTVLATPSGRPLPAIAQGAPIPGLFA
jgi:hypothetical protein